eukprot:SAG22_NODE_1623_length_3962_cov_20.394253_4_plen_161_part_00
MVRPLDRSQCKARLPRLVATDMRTCDPVFVPARPPGNDLTDDAAPELVAALLDDPASGQAKLTHLHLNDNMLGDGAAPALARLIETGHSRLRVLDVQRNHLGLPGVQALLAATKKAASPWLQHVRVAGNTNDPNLKAAALNDLQADIDAAIAAKHGKNEL